MEPAARPGRLPLPAVKGQIRFDRVAFRYRPDASPTLQGGDLTIEAGETIGVVGSSGSGKSTLTKLVQRLYVSESGRVLIVAHRLSTVRRCDRIVTAEEGRVTEQGTHDGLVRSGGRYAEQWIPTTPQQTSAPPAVKPGKRIIAPH